jgi:pimeloyl-ACP methyl ester carboxylesterase
MTSRAEEGARRSRRRRLLAGVALSAAALGVPLLLRRLGAAPRLPPHGWGRGHRYSWRGEDVHFQQVGDGPAVVLLHSLGPGHDGDEWHRAAELLAPWFDVFAPDLPGWGRSARCRLDPSPALYADLLRDFLADVVRRPAVVVAAGRSASFAVAAAAAKGTTRIRGLALVSPRGIASAEEGAELTDRLLARLARSPLFASAAVQLFTSRGAIRRHLEGEVFAAPERADAAQLEHCFRSARQPGAQRALLAYLAGDLALDVSELLPQLTVPVWLGWGRQSSSPLVETADLWLRLLPHDAQGRSAPLEVFDGSGPLPHLEVPVDFSRRLRTFLDAA